jgi:hypothetical protein
MVARYPKKPIHHGAFYTEISRCFYEFMQPHIKLGIFDCSDIVTIVIFGIAVMGMTKLIDDAKFIGN